jgi:hypothetical protein
MGIIRIALESEHGAIESEVNGNTHLIDPLLESLSDTSSHCLQYIDPYGDTVFNRGQMEPFIREWDSLHASAKSSEVRTLFHEVRVLAEKCASEPHLYLKFYGD